MIYLILLLDCYVYLPLFKVNRNKNTYYYISYNKNHNSGVISKCKKILFDNCYPCKILKFILLLNLIISCQDFLYIFENYINKNNNNNIYVGIYYFFLFHYFQKLY